MPEAPVPKRLPIRIGLCSGTHDDFGEIIDTVRLSEHSLNPQPTARNLIRPPAILRLGLSRNQKNLNTDNRFAGGLLDLRSPLS
ncbi:MAG: hypothetical protein RLZZ396_379 [Planctomycetota bacterium]